MLEFPAAKPVQSSTILVVDDEKTVRDFCATVLTRAGYRVISAEDGILALEMVKAARFPIDLALLDVRMPKMGGPELLVELLDCPMLAESDVRFILMSGYADVSNSPPLLVDQFSRNRSLYSFLQKPFTAAVLLGAVWQELGAEQKATARG